ncbi:MAG: glutathione S-transferase family protein [Lysobacterales bacterium]|jgi:glutathione S-transferase|nr:MAG: glutathione S-transferase family protein [Xanthomonadales bacterium]
MLKLHGFPVSNYTNMVEFALLEKGLPYEYVLTIPDQSEAFLGKSPRGKVPFLATPQGTINETDAILDYLEERGEGRALLPRDPYERAYVRSLMKELELYVELPARSCFAEAFFGGKLPDPIKAKAADELNLGFATLGRHGRFAPWLAGAEFTLADVVFAYSADLANTVSKQLFGIDHLARLPAAAALMQRLTENAHYRAIAARRDAGLPTFIATMQARLAAARA